MRPQVQILLAPQTKIERSGRFPRWEAPALSFGAEYGLETVSVRIGSCFPEPTSVRTLSVWMSPADGACLLQAALTAENDVGHTVVYGFLRQHPPAVGPEHGSRALGYDPRDDSEPYAEKLIAEHGELDPENIAHAYLGGHFVSDPPI